MITNKKASNLLGLVVAALQGGLATEGVNVDGLFYLSLCTEHG